MDDPPPKGGSNLVGPSMQAAPPKKGLLESTLLDPEWYLDSVPLESRIQAKMAYRVAAEMGRETKVIWGNTSYMSLPGRVYVTGGTVVAGLTGIRDLSDAGATETAVDARPQGTGERVLKGGLGTVQIVLTAVPIAKLGTKLLSLESEAASTVLNAETTAAARTAEGAPLGNVAAGELAPTAGRPQFNAGEQVGQTFDPARLESILDRFEQIGGSTIRGEEAARLNRSLGAKALYFPAEGGPGTLVIPPGATRVQVAEELLHYRQYRARGFPSSDPQSNPLLRLEIEVEAQTTLIDRIGPRRGWTGPELDELRNALEIWLKALQQAGGGT